MMTKTLAEIAAQLEEPLQKGTIERDCEECGKEFQARMRAVQKGYGRFCSRSCGAVGRARTLGLRVGEESKEYEKQYRKQYDKLYRERAKVASRSCEECGKEFQVRIDRSRDKNGHGRFCSQECSGIGTARARGLVVGRSSAQFYRELSYEARREQRIKRYGLSLQDFNAMLVAQQNRCAICERGFEDIKPYVDHNHETGEVRGLLCNDCNLLLGHAKDSQDILQSAVRYLATAR